MEKFGKIVCKYKKTIIIVMILLLIPSILGIKATKTNYDILVYLPEDIETVEGQKILTNDFKMGAFSIVLLENMQTKEIRALEENIKKINSVEKVIGISDIIGDNIPIEMIPEEFKDRIYKDGTTAMVVTFKDAMSSDETMQAIEKLRNITNKQCKISGMTSTLLDTRNLANKEIIMYILIAILLCLIVLGLALDSYFAPIILLLSIGIAILYNMGTNVLLGEISYITKAISAVLQLGVTMDFAIFLYNSYRQEQEHTNDMDDAMSKAISKTFTSVLGSSLTTIAGFLALCSMNLTLGKDIGIVMAKGVLFGVISVITILPALILQFDKLIKKTKHKEILPRFKALSEFNLEHYKIILLIFILIIPLALNGYIKTKVYYKLDKSLPKELDSVIANETLKDKFGLVSQELILIDENLDVDKNNKMLKEIEELEGVDFTLASSKLSKLGLPEEFIPEDLLEIIKNNGKQMILVNSKFEIATAELNNQIGEINKIVKKYDQDAKVVGEGALMKDLVEISDHDFKAVNIFSIGVIFIIMAIVLKSILLPIILISIIEVAIFINMGIPYYTNVEIPFIASIVIGTIQLGATIDYAILITTKYISNRKEGCNKKEAIKESLNTSIGSIIVSGLCFFAATFGVGIYSKIEMIGSLCTLMSRGAIISVIIVVMVLPAALMLFDKLICKTTKGMKMLKN